MIGASKIARDITESKKLERIKREFVATVSHELRTPLTSIRGALGLTMGKCAVGLPEKVHNLLAVANRNSEHLASLVNDILDLEKIESGHMDVCLRELDLVQVTARALEDNRGLADIHGITLSGHRHVERAPAMGDENRLLQVLANLLSNAAKFSPRGAEVELRLSENCGVFRVSVFDRGPGIPEEFRTKIFQRFSRADNSDARNKSGTGLGLAISKAIIERHQGCLSYQCEMGKGTEFYFEILGLGARDADADKPLVLHVEDDPEVIQFSRELLRDLARHQPVGTLRRARELLAANRFDLVLLDLTLADGNGEDLLPELRDHCPVVIFSARIPSCDLGAPVRAALTKSQSSDNELRAIVESILTENALSV